jgi:hypothetical protein
MEKADSVYLLGGIALASELPLPELPQCEAKTVTGLPRVNIHTGPVPFLLPGGVEVDCDCLATPGEYLLRVPGIARYRVSGGVEVLVEPDRNALPLDVRAYLLGTIFAVLCHQRGLLPLHASAVRSGSGVAAFLARSGQGKSSLAANLAERGFQVVSDDICLVDTSIAADAVAIPTAPWLKLWRASLQQLGRRLDGLEQVFSEDDKYRLPVEGAKDGITVERLPIRTLIFLEMQGNGDHEDGSEVGIKGVTPLHAIALLMNLVHQAHLVEAIGKREESFLRCGRVLSQAKAYRLVRPWGFQHMERTLDTIEDLLREN